MNLPVIDTEATGRNISRLMAEHEMSVTGIRDYLGLNTTYAVYKWLNGASMPAIDNMLALSVLFGISMNEILVYA